MPTSCTLSSRLWIALTLVGAMITVAHADTATLRFAWPAPSAVDVVEEITRDGQTSTIAYTLEVTRDADGTDTLVRFAGFRFLSLEGKKVDAELKAQLGPASALAAAIPDLRVDAKGVAKGVDGLKAMADRVVALMTEVGQVDESQKAAVLAQLTSPQMREMLQTRMFDTWNAWVGLWVNRPLKPGKKIREKVPFPGAPGETITARRTLRREASKGAAVTLHSKLVVDGPAARRAMEDAVRQMAASQGHPERFKEGMVKAFRRVLKVEAKTDAATLKPQEVRTVETRRVKLADQPESLEEERHRYRFTWR